MEQLCNRIFVSMAKQENKNPQEPSSIFHSIMKASVTPKKIEADKKPKPIKPYL